MECPVHVGMETVRSDKLTSRATGFPKKPPGLNPPKIRCAAGCRSLPADVLSGVLLLVLRRIVFRIDESLDTVVPGRKEPNTIEPAKNVLAITDDPDSARKSKCHTKLNVSSAAAGR